MSQLDGLLLIHKQDIESIKRGQQMILDKLEELTRGNKGSLDYSSPYITAGEFMAAVRIRRWKFNNLLREGKVRTIKKKRKIYVPKEEIERYFREVKD